jgi:hypothetical protein
LSSKTPRGSEDEKQGKKRTLVFEAKNVNESLPGLKKTPEGFSVLGHQ